MSDPRALWITPPAEPRRRDRNRYALVQAVDAAIATLARRPAPDLPPQQVTGQEPGELSEASDPRTASRPRLRTIASSAGSTGRRRPSEPERCPFRVAADRPVLPRVHDLPAEFDDLPKRGLQIGDRQVRQREAVAGTTATLVEPDDRASVLCLQALALFRLALGKRDAEQVLPEAAGAVEVVRRELDQEPAQLPDPVASAKPHSRQTKRVDVRSSRIPIVTPQAGQIGGWSSSSVLRWSSFTARDGIVKEGSPAQIVRARLVWP
jgi:hypothetical protein